MIQQKSTYACLSGFQHSTKYKHCNTLTQHTRSQR